MTVSAVYDSIKHSNSSLKRRSKKLLEDSIDRVLLALKEQENDSDSMDGDFDGIADEPESGAKLKVRIHALLVINESLLIASLCRIITL